MKQVSSSCLIVWNTLLKHIQTKYNSKLNFLPWIRISDKEIKFVDLELGFSRIKTEYTQKLRFLSAENSGFSRIKIETLEWENLRLTRTEELELWAEFSRWPERGRATRVLGIVSKKIEIKSEKIGISLMVI